MPQLVHDRVADLALRVTAIARDAQNGSTKNHHLIGQRRMIAKDAQELVVIIVEHFQVLVRRLGLDQNHDVFQELRELGWQLAEGVLDELLEFTI